MTNNLEIAKKELEKARNEGGSKAPIPVIVWVAVKEAMAQQFNLKEITSFLGLRLDTANKYFNRNKNKNKKNIESNLKIIELPRPQPLKAQIPILELSLPSGATIKVYSV